jgi:hypothetical protein
LNARLQKPAQHKPDAGQNAAGGGVTGGREDSAEPRQQSCAKAIAQPPADGSGHRARGALAGQKDADLRRRESAAARQVNGTKNPIAYRQGNK